MKEKVDRLETAMLQLPQAQADVVHSFAPGVYVRQVTLLEGTYAIGHYQKTTHLNVMLSGWATMVEPDGTHVERIAPLTYVSGPGRKVGYIHEKVVWLNIYATEETDVEKLEALLLDKSAGWQDGQKALACDRAGDIADFGRALEELGVSPDLVRQQSESHLDQRAFPVGSYKVKIGASRIEGRGLIATASIQAGEVIAPARLGGFRTPAGRWTNHAQHPNAVMRRIGSGHDIELVALRDIAGCHGGVDGEEITVDYRQSRALAMAGDAL